MKIKTHHWAMVVFAVIILKLFLMLLANPRFWYVLGSIILLALAVVFLYIIFIRPFTV